MDRIITYNLEDNFIKNLAEYLDKNYISQGKDISKLVFIFGGKRPNLFLKKELSRRIKKSFIPPQFFTIDEFVEYIASKKKAFSKISDLDACFTIYDLAKSVAPEIVKDRLEFSRFLPWAREILSFIEQLDVEDIHSISLKGIQENAKIGYDVPENINRMLESIIAIRKSYHKYLDENQLYSHGYMYLMASSVVSEIELEEFEHLFFCGFFYLHNTEKALIKKFYESKKATLFFQGDQKEWSVLNKLANSLGASLETEKPAKENYELSIQAGFDVHSEVCLVRDILKNTKATDKTVIVLPEPDNVIPLLSEISSEVDNYNVSIGYPLKRSSLYSLFESIFKAQSTKKDSQYYSKDYLKALSHPLVKNLKLLANPSATRVLVHKIEEIILGIEETELSGSLFIKLTDIESSRELFDSAMSTMKNMDIEATRDELKDVISQLHDILFKSWEKLDNFYDFSQSLGKLLDILVKKSFLDNYPLNMKMAERIFTIKDELEIASFKSEKFAKDELFKIFENKLDNEIISFSGSPLKGLQILGLFETRSLNFENVIFMDVNEATLPSLKIYEPLIPREVMISLGLNRLEKEEEIQHYQFKRLIAGAKKVFLVYQERADKEKSRFIEEIVWNRQKEAKDFNVANITRANFKVEVLPKQMEVAKTKEILEFLKKREYSASSVNTYLNCPLRFYFQYVLGFQEKEELRDDPEGRDIGTFVHELLEETFGKFVGKKPNIDQKFEEYFANRLENKFTKDFELKMKSDSFLIKRILEVRLNRFLAQEKHRPVEKLISLESKFSDTFKLESGNFKLKAIIDRIELLGDGSYLILDYKTGSTDIMPEAKFEKLELAGYTRGVIKNTIKSFQLPIYYHVVSEHKDFKGERVNACLYSLKDLGMTQFFKKEEQFANREAIMSGYLKALDALFAEIINPTTTFKADEDNSRQCQYCPFFYLCR